MLCFTNAATRPSWTRAPLAAVALLATTACGSVVVGNPGTGGATSTGAGTVTVTGTSAVTTGAATTTGVTTTSGTAVASSSSAAVTSSSSSGSGACNPACGFMLTCCDGTCAETDNDLLNCGGCGIACAGATPFCHEGKCEAAPCTSAQPCPSADVCCGTQCCAPGEICCDTYGGPIQQNPHCEKPENGTCQHSCFACN